MTELRERHGAKARLYRAAPSWDDRPTVAIGGFRCPDAASGAALLTEIAEEMAGDGITRMIGPMDGDTWHSYRLVTDSDGRAPFLLEPTSPPHHEAAFRAAGFDPIATYHSGTAPLHDLGPAPPLPPGTRLDPWDGAAAERQLAEIHALSGHAFADNPFYQPIGLDAFLDLYRPILPLLKPDLVFLARGDDGGLLGYLFGVPDYAQGPAPHAAILKTYASAIPGLGRALAHAFHTAAGA
ncbi:MAG: hypothetical protein AAF914_13115, partial [Pseudomonadota bacterium]